MIAEQVRDLVIFGTERAGVDFIRRHQLKDVLIVRRVEQLAGLRLDKFRVHLVDLAHHGDWESVHHRLRHLAAVVGRPLESLYGDLR